MVVEALNCEILDSADDGSKTKLTEKLGDHGLPIIIDTHEIVDLFLLVQFLFACHGLFQVVPHKVADLW